MKTKRIFIIIICILIITVSTILFTMFKYKDNDSNENNSKYLSYALTGTIKLQSSDGNDYVKILSCYPEDKIIRFSLETNISKEITPSNINSILEFINENGDTLIITVDEIFNAPTDSSVYKQLVLLSLPLKGDPTRLSLRYNNYDLPIVLIDVGLDSIHRNIKNKAQSGKIEIVAFPQYTDDKTAEITLILSDPGMKLSSFSIITDGMELSDKDGNIYEQKKESDQPNKYYYNAKFSDQLYLDITSVEITYEGSAESAVINGLWHIILKY